MPDQTPPLLDQKQLDDTFSKYTNTDINQKGIQPTPFQGLNSPNVDVLGGGRALSPLDGLIQNVSKRTKQGTLGPGGVDTTLGALHNQPFDTWDPALHGKDEDMMSLNQGFLDKAANGLIKMGGIALNTTVASTLGIINGLGEWAKTGRFSSFMDNDFNNALDENMKWMEKQFPHYRTQREREGSWWEPENLFTANFVFDNVIKNLGYSLGTLAPALAVGKGLNALRLSSKLFAAGEALSATEAIETAATLPRMQQLGFIEGKLSQIVSSGKNLAGKALKGMGAPAVGGVEQGGSAVNAISSALSSVGEASMEGYNNLNEFRNNLIQDYKDKNNGIAPTGEALDAINKQSYSVGNYSFLLNMAILTGTQYIQLPKILSSTFKGEKNLVNRTIQNPTTGLWESAIPTKGLKGAAFKAGKFSSLFFNPTEAFEEGAQYSVQRGTQDYYGKKYRGDRKDQPDFLSSLGYGIGKTLSTDEGLENVFLGGLSGSLMTAGWVSKQGFGKTGDIAERGLFGTGGIRKTNTEDYVKGLNDTSIKSYLKDGVDQANRAITIQEDREDAIRQGDILESKDLEFDYSHNYLSHRIKWGRYDLVEQDINEMRQEVSMPGGLAKLQQEGKASEFDTKETFLARLQNFQEHASTVKEQYEDLNTKYSGILTGDGKRMYSPQVIDQMVYTASKVKDYDKRLKGLAQSLSSVGINPTIVDEAVRQTSLNRDNKNDLARNEALGTVIEELVNNVESLDTTEEEIEDKKTELKDYVEIAMRRKSFLEEYKKIKATPIAYEEVVAPKKEAPVTGQTNKPVDIKTKSGSKSLEVGQKYYLSSIESKTKQGLIKKEYPGFEVVSVAENGDLVVKDEKGQIKTIPASELAKYDVGKISDIEKNPKFQFYWDNRNRIFNYKFKDGTKPGVLRYSTKQDQLIFEYIKDGKTRTIPVYGKDFSYEIAKSKGYKEPLITRTEGQLSPEEEKAVTSTTDVVSKFTQRFQMLAGLVTDTRENLEKTNKELERKREELNKLEDAYRNLEQTAKQTTEKGNLKKVAKAALKTMSVLKNTAFLLDEDIERLEDEKEQLEAALPYFEEIYENSDVLPDNLRDVLPQLKEEIEQIEEAIDLTEQSIKENKSLLARVKDMLESAYNFFKKYSRQLQDNLPFSNIPDYQDKLETFLGEEGAKQFIENKEGFTSAINALSVDISELETGLDIPLNEEKIRDLKENLKELQAGLKELKTKRVAREKLLDFFQDKIDAYDKAEAKKKALITDKKLQEKFYSSVKALEGEEATEDPNTEMTKESYKKDLSIIARTGTSQKYETASPEGPARREQSFLLNLSKGQFAGRNIKTLLVTKNTEEALGLKGIIDPSYPEAIRIVYVEVNSDGSYNFLDKEGNTHSNRVDSTPFIAEDKKLQQELNNSLKNLPQPKFSLNFIAPKALGKLPKSEEGDFKEQEAIKERLDKLNELALCLWS